MTEVLPAVVPVVAPPVTVTGAPMELTAMPTARPLVLVTLITLEPKVTLLAGTATGTGVKVRLFVPAAPLAFIVKVKGPVIPVMVAPVGAPVPKMRIPTARPTVLGTVTVVLTAVVLLTTACGVSVSVLAPDFTSVTAPVPLLITGVLNVAVLLV